MEEKKELFSTHILMLPFIFDEDVTKINQSLIKNGQWEYGKFDAGHGHENYNEYIYFYEHVRKTLYSDKDMTETQAAYYFEFKEQKGVYVLELSNKEYQLDIVGISMRTFDTGVGILSIELENSTYYQAKDILIINDFARRLFPQFLTQNKTKNLILDEVQQAFLPKRVGIKLENIEAYEDFSYYTDNVNISKDVTNLPHYIHVLLGKDFTSHKNSEDRIHIEPIIDDRMFVISMYMNDALAEKMKIYDNQFNQYEYETNNFWYEYVFVDGNGKTCQSKHMTKKLIKETTYDRWVEWGTLFGLSRYSFVALTGSWYGKNRLAPHMQTMYFQMFTLLLAYRASILHFSKRVAALTLKEKESFNLETLQSDVTTIYRDYINFQNNLLFREVTAQEQGIELYEQALKVMQIDKQVKDLDNEIEELHAYVSMKVQEAQSKQAEERENRLETISNLGAVFLPATVIAGIFGMNTIEFAQNTNSMWLSGALIFFSALSGFVVIKSKYIVVKVFSAAVLLGCVVTSLFFMPNKKSTSITQTQLTKKEITNVNKSDR